MNRRNFRESIRARVLVWLGLAAVLAFACFVRWRLLDMPLERDEGEFAYGAQLLLQGVSPYEHAYNVALKLPGTCVVYALIMAVLGQTIAAIHTGVIFVNLASTVLVFILARRICGDAAGVVGAGTFALLSLVPTTLGLAAHATHFVVLSVLAGVLLLQDLDGDTPSVRIFFGGLLIGLGILMEQIAAPFGLFAASWVLWRELSSTDKQWPRLAKRLGWLALGGFLPFLLTCAVIALAGDFGQFWFWTFQYAAVHEAVFTVGTGLQEMIRSIALQFSASPGLWGLAIAGLLLLFFTPSLKRWRFFIASFPLFSFLAVCPGWYFRGHYFIQLLPAAGLLVAVAFRSAGDYLASRKLPFWPPVIPFLIFAVAAAASVVQWRDIYFRLTPVQACRAVYDANPFPEAVEIGRYLQSHCPPDATIAILGSEPEIFFYSQRRSATGFICTYPLVEPQPYAGAMQEEMIQEIENARPVYVVFVNIRGSWAQSTARVENKIPDWWNGYAQNYELVKTVEMPEETSPDILGNGSQANRGNAPPGKISIYRRRS